MPNTPYCIIAQVAFGSHVRTMRIPEARAANAVEHGWFVLIRDSEMPGPLEPFRLTELQSNPHRYHDDVVGGHYLDGDPA